MAGLFRLIAVIMLPADVSHTVLACMPQADTVLFVRKAGGLGKEERNVYMWVSVL